MQNNANKGEKRESRNNTKMKCIIIFMSNLQKSKSFDLIELFNDASRYFHHR